MLFYFSSCSFPSDPSFYQNIRFPRLLADDLYRQFMGEADDAFSVFSNRPLFHTKPVRAIRLFHICFSIPDRQYVPLSSTACKNDPLFSVQRITADRFPILTQRPQRLSRKKRRAAREKEKGRPALLPKTTKYHSFSISPAYLSFHHMQGTNIRIFDLFHQCHRMAFQKIIFPFRQPLGCQFLDNQVADRLHDKDALVIAIQGI